MVKISIIYPNRKNSWFDMDYYINRHLPVTIKFMSGRPGFRGLSVDKGLKSEFWNSKSIFIAQCNFLFDTEKDFFNAYKSHADKIKNDIKNYTDIKPVIQISRKMEFKNTDLPSFT